MSLPFSASFSGWISADWEREGPQLSQPISHLSLLVSHSHSHSHLCLDNYIVYNVYIVFLVWQVQRWQSWQATLKRNQMRLVFREKKIRLEKKKKLKTLCVSHLSLLRVAKTKNNCQTQKNPQKRGAWARVTLILQTFWVPNCLLPDAFHDAAVAWKRPAKSWMVINSFKLWGNYSQNSSKFKNSVGRAIFTTNCEEESDRKREYVSLLKIFCPQPQEYLTLILIFFWTDILFVPDKKSLGLMH